jgi:LCP family protein required for cell wall assembly
VSIQINDKNKFYSPAFTSKGTSGIGNSNLKKKNFKIEVLIFLGIVLLLFAGVYFFRYLRFGQSGGNSFSNPLSFYSIDKPMVILLAGTDQVYETDKYGYAVKSKKLSFNGRTDTIILAKFDPTIKRITALNIPRDTRIYLNGKRAEKINAINTIGGNELLKDILQDLLDVHIDHYVIVNTEGVQKIIDALGGIEVDIPKRMVYRDRTDGLNIDFQPGKKVLTGKEAVAFLRFRHDSLGDIGRIQRQQEFFRAVKEKLANPLTITKLPQLAQDSMKAVSTDLTVSEIVKLANFTKSLSSESQVFATLPGDFSSSANDVKVVYESVPVESSSSAAVSGGDGSATNDTGKTPATVDGSNTGAESTNTVIQKRIIHMAPSVSYWIPNEDEIVKVVDRLFGYDSEFIDEFDTQNKKAQSRSKISVAIESASPDSKEKGKSSSQKNTIKIVSKLLQSKGYRIVDISSGAFDGNHNSAIYTQKAQIKDAQKVRKDLGLSSNVKVLGGSIGSPLADITIVVGPEIEKELSQKVEEKSK